MPPKLLNDTDSIVAGIINPEELDPNVHLTQDQQALVDSKGVNSDLNVLKVAYQNEVTEKMNKAVEDA